MNLLRDIEINIYYLNPYSKAYFTRQTGIRSVDFGSIFLFINGFRIPPYGDQGNDWLGMELRKGQGFNRFLGTCPICTNSHVSLDFCSLDIRAWVYCCYYETIYVKKSNNEFWKTTKFWMGLFAINFAIGVATGLIMEFEFALNWAKLFLVCWRYFWSSSCN